MAAKTLDEFFSEYRSGFNPITGERNLFKDLTDQQVWDAAIKSAEENGNSLQQLKAEIAAVVHDMTVDAKKVCGIEVEYYLNRLRQLSAV